MKKRQWNIQRCYVQTPDALSRWDRSYQSLIQWSQAAFSDQPERPLSENGHEPCHVCSGFDRALKHKPKRSNNNYSSCMNTVNNKGGSGKSKAFFAMMATAERAYVAQDWTDFAIRCAMPPSIACSSLHRIVWLATTSTKCCSWKNLSAADASFSFWINP